MPRQICLVQHEKNVTRDDQPRMFTIVERAPILLREHNEIWKILQAAGKKSLVIDNKHPEEAFAATVTEIDVLSRPEIERAMMQAREVALAAEETNRVSVLSKELDRCFDAQREWLVLRVVLSQASRGKSHSKRALLLFE